MDEQTTLAIGAATLILAIFFGWRGAQPPNVIKGPRLVPHRFLMLLFAALTLMMLVHLVNIHGVVTGR
jgi:hypothetical protein